jgi:formate C-acetyltransferase
MKDRVQRLRQKSLDIPPSVSIERAVSLTDFYRENTGKHPQPVLRAKAYYHLCANKTIYIGDEELIVGERGHEPKAAPTFPEIICHSADDLRILDSRAMTSYRISTEDIECYERDVIPFWQGRSLRDQIFDLLPKEWHQAFSAGIFTEFMEQRAPGHTVGDGKIFAKGMLDFKTEIAAAIGDLGTASDPEAAARRDQLEAMDIVADATILFAERHADKADEMAAHESDPERWAELERIAAVCRHVPAHAPRDFWEALQTYWFVHLGVITVSRTASPTAASTGTPPKSCWSVCG